MTQPCPNCGTLNSENSRFCLNCGNALKPAGQSSEIATPPSNAQSSESSFAAPGTPDMPANLASSATDFVFPSYVVKKSEEPVSDPQAPTMPMGTFAPPSYSSSQPASAVPPPASTAYQTYIPGGGGKRDGAAYTPYSSGAVTALEKPREGRSWLLPVIGLLALILLALGAISGFLLISNRSVGVTPNPKVPAAVNSDTPLPQQTPLPANATEEDKIKAVIQRSNDEQIKAWRDLDVSVLQGTRIGQVLTDNIKMVNDLKKENMYAVPVNDSIKFGEVKINGNNATAHTVETWRVTFYNRSDNSKIQSRGPDTLNEIYYLVKQNGQWMIKDLTIEEQGTKAGPTPTPNLQ